MFTINPLKARLPELDAAVIGRLLMALKMGQYGTYESGFCGFATVDSCSKFDRSGTVGWDGWDSWLVIT